MVYIHTLHTHLHPAMSDIGSSPQPFSGTNRLAGLTSFVPEINSPPKLAAGWLTWEGVPRGTALAGGTGGRGLSKLSLALPALHYASAGVYPGT